jgi:acyl-CoA dehydrogenase
MASPFYTAEHEAYREVVRRFVEKEIEPYAHEWDEAGGLPRVPPTRSIAIACASASTA